MRHTVVMVTSSYPRFPGDGVGSFIEPIAKSVAARGHAVHLVAPWHPAITRGAEEDGVRFHFYRYAPFKALEVFGYAGGLKADTHLRAAAWAAAPLALASGWRAARHVAGAHGATVLHAHWVLPSGAIAAAARGGRPLVVSLHGSDVFVAERRAIARRAARFAFRRAAWVTACSDDLRDRAAALGAARDRLETLPYGVDAAMFAPNAQVRADMRAVLGIGEAPLVFSAGRLVSKKGFEFLIEAAARMTDLRGLTVAIAGDGDLRDSLSRCAEQAAGRVRLLGNRSQQDIARLAAAADVIAVPSVHDAAGNVDGLPNFALEALASGTPVIATRVGGLPQVIDDRRTGRLVEERDGAALAAAIRETFADRAAARAMGQAAREKVIADYGWDRHAARLEAAYDRVCR